MQSESGWKLRWPTYASSSAASAYDTQSPPSTASHPVPLTPAQHWVDNRGCQRRLFQREQAEDVRA